MADIAGLVHHVNLSVSDLERSTAWYQRLFGLSELARLSADDGEWTKAILRHPAGLLIGLTQHRRNDSAPFTEWRCGVDHFALVVKDRHELTAWEDRLDELEVERSPVKTTPLGSLITVRDPDNIQFELYAPGPPGPS